MFCPQCRYEFKAGITVCPDCNVPLVDVLPPEPQVEYIERIPVFKTTDQSKIMIAKSLLEEAGIDYFAQGEGIMDLFGVGRLGFNPIVGAVEFTVKPEDEQKAHEILDYLIDGQNEKGD
ncbi:MAG: DUF2007 domain-containing protein [FCB group bacterium]|nr:DUF2007 domain-containing protein [FCB group bacterium]